MMCLAAKASRTGKSLSSSEEKSLAFWGCSGSLWLHFSHSCLRNSLTGSLSSYQGSSASFYPVSSWNLYWRGAVNGWSFHISFAQGCLSVWQVLVLPHLLPLLVQSSHIKKVLCCWQKFRILFAQTFATFSFRLFTQYLLNKRVMVISGSSLQSLCKGTAYLLWKRRSHLPQCTVITLLADVTHQDIPFVSGLVLWNSML